MDSLGLAHLNLCSALDGLFEGAGHDAIPETSGGEGEASVDVWERTEARLGEVGGGLNWTRKAKPPAAMMIVDRGARGSGWARCVGRLGYLGFGETFAGWASTALTGAIQMARWIKS